MQERFKEIISFLIGFILFLMPGQVGAKVTIHAQTSLGVELIGYDGFAEQTLFAGKLSPESGAKIDTDYRGLALLTFSGGQSYPVILGEKSFTLDITNPNEPPSFLGSAENIYFYKLLTGEGSGPAQYSFAFLMIRARELLESTTAIGAMDELAAKKREVEGFVVRNYENLRHSDMIRRLVAQYFMMYEYVDYHVQGAPAADIQVKYRQEVLAGVGSWLESLQPAIPEHEILNYIVSLYYRRSMVAMAALIMDNFSDAAYCPGDDKQHFDFPVGLPIVGADGEKKGTLADFAGRKIITFVSEECPVSMVAAVSMARRQEGATVIAVPLEKLSAAHLGMAGMVSTPNLLFLNDEKWRQYNLAEKIRLPFVVQE